MLTAAIIEQNNKLRAQLARQERQLKAVRCPQLYLLNMVITLLLGIVLGFLLFFVVCGGC